MHLINFKFMNLIQYAGKEATVRIGHETTDWFQIGKGIHQGCILSPCLFNFYAEYIMRNAGLDETQGGIKIAIEISITSDMQNTTLMAESKEQQKSLFMANRWGNYGNSDRLYFFGLPNHCRW